LVGEAERDEAVNPTTVGNALDLLLRDEVLVRVETPSGRGSSDRHYGQGERWDALEALRARLAGALAER
jgi:hypothetical protein